MIKWCVNNSRRQSSGLISWKIRLSRLIRTVWSWVISWMRRKINCWRRINRFKSVKRKFLISTVSLRHVWRLGIRKKRLTFLQGSKWLICSRKWASSRNMPVTLIQKPSNCFKFLAKKGQNRVSSELQNYWEICHPHYRNPKSKFSANFRPKIKKKP